MNKVLICLMFLYIFSTAYPRFSSSFEGTITYNSNLFLLSPKEITEYILSTNPSRYPYSSADDIDLTIVSRINFHLSKFTKLRLLITGHQFLVNQEKSYGVINYRLEQRVNVLGTFLIYGIWLPNYLIRYYREFKTGNYYPCRFGERMIGFAFHRQFGNLKIKPGYGHEFYHYVKPFSYYNTRVHRFSGGFDYQVVKNLKVESEYSFRLAQAADTLPDISYREHNFAADLSFSPTILKGFSLKVGYQFHNRKYTTENPGDIYHFRRVDRTQLISLGGEYRFRNLDLSLKSEFEWRDVKSPYYQEIIEEVKDYRANKLSFGIRVPIKKESGTDDSAGRCKKEKK